MEVQETRQGPPLYFKSSGRVVKIFGRESISNPNIALLEMIKNSYDADATNVTISFENVTTDKGRIVISDNGVGMTIDEIDRYWMTAATDMKTVETLSKVFKRPKIGQKGIARFALDSLSQKVELTSMPAEAKEGCKLIVDWSQYEQPGAQFEKVQNSSFLFGKRSHEQGFEITLSGLRDEWDREKIMSFTRDAALVVPPTSSPENFRVTVKCSYYPDLSVEKIRNAFLKQAVYAYYAKLDKEGRLLYKMKFNGKWKSYPVTKTMKYSCGPAEFTFFFFYRDKGKYEKLGVSIDDLRKFLDEWGNIKLYRDNFRVKPYGDPNNDWLGLESLRINDMSVFPGNDQVFGFVKISKEGNPQIIDTTTREGIIWNTASEDLREFVRDGIKFFAMNRKSIEGKRKITKPSVKYELPKLKTIITHEPVKKLEIETFLDFGKKYPYVFYNPLEDEINTSYKYSLPNASLLLIRKLVENLTYNLLEFKFPKDINLWYNTQRSRPHDFGVLLDNLETKKNEFQHDQKDLVEAFLSRIKPLKREANSKAHLIIEYLDDKNELLKMKVPEIIDILLKLIEKVKPSK